MQPTGLTIPSEDEYLNCIRCGLCLSVCPTYRESLKETCSPRGRVALTRKCLDGELESTPKLMDQIYSCFDCLACNDACPVGIRPADLMLGMRKLQEQKHPTFWKKILFNSILSRPGRMEFASLPLRTYEQSGSRTFIKKSGLGKLLPRKIRDLEAMLPGIPRHPLRRTISGIDPAASDLQSRPDSANNQNGIRVGFFPGCVQSLLFAETSQATIRVLERNHCNVVIPANTVCCGMPALGYGQIDFVREQARRNIALFEKQNIQVIITDCATCGSMLKDYNRILADDPEWKERADTFSRKVRDINEFLSSIPLEKPQGRLDVRITYHDPCHLRRGQGIHREPRELIKMIDGVEFIELPEADWCCGSAGSQLITHYDTSIKVLKRKTDNIGLTRADYVATACPGCQMQLNVGILQRGWNTRVVHPIELLDKAYGVGYGVIQEATQNKEPINSEWYAQ